MVSERRITRIEEEINNIKYHNYSQHDQSASPASKRNLNYNLKTTKSFCSKSSGTEQPADLKRTYGGGGSPRIAFQRSQGSNSISPMSVRANNSSSVGKNVTYEPIKEEPVYIKTAGNLASIDKETSTNSGFGTASIGLKGRNIFRSNNSSWIGAKSNMLHFGNQNSYYKDL